MVKKLLSLFFEEIELDLFLLISSKTNESFEKTEKINETWKKKINDAEAELKKVNDNLTKLNQKNNSLVKDLKAKEEYYDKLISDLNKKL